MGEEHHQHCDSGAILHSHLWHTANSFGSLWTVSEMMAACRLSCMTVSPGYRFHAQIRVSVFLSGNKGNYTVGPCRTMPAGAHAAQRFAQGCSTGSALGSGSFAQLDHFTTQYDGKDHRRLPVPVIDDCKQQGALSCKGSQ